ncbi:type VII secretion protein EssA [Bacillus sp. z60-18]|uniref:type VII secretion protein EssA n=1 Tax=unclassified Bacillus (in: firmicutes) TaxID=185979 RepID=UPI0024094D4D|nr:type VII secretion protein EssA [Bacillus sp. HSf4]WFA04376.1 type VII secretion protein EssA [Bacillus sp. HSf4]
MTLMRNARWGKKGIMAVMLSFFLFTPLVKADETDEVDVKPNEYEKQDVKIETDYLQEDDAVYKEDIPIPEELKEFSFSDKKKDGPLEQLKGLSGSFTNKSNSVASKLKELNLSFSAEPSLGKQEDDMAEDKQSIFLPILYGVLILLCIAGLFFLIPRVVSGQQKK